MKQLVSYYLDEFGGHNNRSNTEELSSPVGLIWRQDAGTALTHLSLPLNATDQSETRVRHSAPAPNPSSAHLHGRTLTPEPSTTSWQGNRSPAGSRQELKWLPAYLVIAHAGVAMAQLLIH
jgi:hypothetical protein